MALPDTLATLDRQPASTRIEVILADGGSRDRTIAIFEGAAAGWEKRGWAAKVVRCARPGRAAQMNVGAQAAAGEILLFLHADTHLPEGAAAGILRALSRPETVGGGFRLRYRERGTILALIGLWASTRARWRGVHYGDQAIFMRGGIFREVGGFPDVPLFEDLLMARRLKRRGRITTVPLAVETSSRRLQHGGILRTAFHFLWLRLRFMLGADPARLRERYPDVREGGSVDAAQEPGSRARQV